MAISAQSIIRRVVDTLQDPTSIRWPVDEVIRYLNDGQREIILYRPDALVRNQTITCTPGTRQSLPADGAKLIEVIRNSNSGAAVRLTNREILDAQVPGWHALTGKADAVHFMYDPRDPRIFYVYPPVTGTAMLDIVYSALPVDVASVGAGGTLANVSGNISVRDIDANALQDYILYRCFMKDSEYAGNAGRAQAHYAAFANALGVEIKATVAVQPQGGGNPNAARTAAV